MSPTLHTPSAEAYGGGRSYGDGAQQAGFTLVELLVVIAIISLLLSILMPSLVKAKSMAMRLKCAHNLKQINLAMRLYLDVNNDTYPCADDPVSRKPFYCLWMGRGWRGFVEPYLGGNIDANNPSVLFCPRDPSDNYESTSYAYSMAFYHSPGQIDAMDENSPQWGKSAQPSIPQKSLDVAKPSGKILIGEWTSNHCRIKGKDPGWWGWLGSRNFLFADGQVRYLKAEQIREANDGNPNPNMTLRGIKGMDWPR